MRLLFFLARSEDKLQVIGKIKTSWPRLDFPPRGPDIKLLSQRKMNQVFDRLRNIVRLDLRRPHVRRDVRDQPLAVARHYLIGRRGGHHHFIAGDSGIRRILWKGTLIQPVADLRT